MKPTKNFGLRCLIMSFIGAVIYLYSCAKDDDLIFKNRRCIEGSGKIITQEISTTGFSEIELKSHANIKIYKGNALSVVVSDYENLVKYQKARVIGSKLVIKAEPDNLCIRNSKASIVITTPEPLNSIYLNGNGNIDIMSDFNNLHVLNISGNGNIIVYNNITTNKLDINIFGAGDIIAKGTTTNLLANIYGTGNIYLKDLISQNAACSILGNGKITVHAVLNLNAAIKGIGNIAYYGNPKLKSTISGIGQIKSMSEN